MAEAIRLPVAFASEIDWQLDSHVGPEVILGEGCQLVHDVRIVQSVLWPRVRVGRGVTIERSKLRRGSLTIAVLAQLRAEHYGYTLRKALADLGLAIDEGTLYPLLRRLETQGLLTSEWREEDKREKRFYRLSAEGRTILKQLLDEWRSLNSALDNIV